MVLPQFVKICQHSGPACVENQYKREHLVWNLTSQISMENNSNQKERREIHEFYNVISLNFCAPDQLYHAFRTVHEERRMSGKVDVENVVWASFARWKIPYRTKFRRTKFRHQVEFSAVLSNEFFSSVSYFPIQFTIEIWVCINLISFIDFSGNISADKIFGSKSDFRQFCAPKFCP